ncbi:MAG: redoxin domain-containing protein [Planctomycetes bacterium]|nr:redoxin domain-containing protein [Planctomycetota bacterium]
MPKAQQDGAPRRGPKAALRRDASVSQQANRNSRQVAADSTGPKAVIQCDESTHDFGTVWVGPALKHSFTIKNIGDKALKITRVKPACGCTIAGPYPRSIEPGESGEFPFSIATKKLRSRFEKSITVESSDPLNPKLRLKVRGEVKRYVDVVPANANFGTLFGGEPQERVINITNNTDDPLEIKLSPPTTDDFEFTLEEKEPGKRFELRVSVSPPYKPGNLTSVITLETNKKAQEKVTVYARAKVPQRIDVQPTSIVVVEPSGTQTRGLSRVIRITNYGATPVKVLEATVDDPEITLTLSERTAGKAYTVMVQMPPNYSVPSTGRTITLTLDDKDKPTVEVPIRRRVSTVRRKPTRLRPAEEMVGKPVPSFRLTTIEGKPASSTDLAGKVTVLNFFAPNCGFCKKQIPRLETVRQKFADKGVRFINVSQKMRKEYSKEEVIAKNDGLGFKGELAINHDNSVGGLFKATSFPTMVVLGKKGKIDAVNVGNIRDLETKLTMQLETLLAGKTIPKTELVTKRPEKPKRARPTDLIGKPAPLFVSKTIEGKRIANLELSKSAATVLNFFASNCPHCKKQIPKLEAVRQKYADKNVRFINVSQKMRKAYTQEQVIETIKKTGFKGELVIDHENKIGKAFNATGFPTMIVIGRSGKVEAVNVGNAADLQSRLSSQLDALIAGKPVSKSGATAAAKPTAQKKQPKKPTQKVAIGKKAPSFDTQTIDGKKVTNAELAKYSATVLNFFAPNCPHCKKQIPKLEKVRKQFADKNVRFINVSQKMRKAFTKEQVLATLKKTGYEGEVVIDHENKIGGAFNARGFPHMIVLGKSGNLEAVNRGNMADLETRLTAQLDALVAGKAIPKKYAQAPASRSNRRPALDLVGKQAPAFNIDTLDGKEVSNADFSKHPATVLNFVAPNCGFCKRQVPTVEKIRAEYEAKGVRFVNISQTMRKEYSAEEVVDIFKTKLKTNLEIATDSGNKIGKLFKATSYPTLFVVGKDGKVSEVFVGAKPNLDTLLKVRLDALIKG